MDRQTASGVGAARPSWETEGLREHRGPSGLARPRSCPTLPGPTGPAATLATGTHPDARSRSPQPPGPGPPPPPPPPGAPAPGRGARARGKGRGHGALPGLGRRSPAAARRSRGAAWGARPLAPRPPPRPSGPGTAAPPRRRGSRGPGRLELPGGPATGGVGEGLSRGTPASPHPRSRPPRTAAGPRTERKGPPEPSQWRRTRAPPPEPLRYRSGDDDQGRVVAANLSGGH
ncbi:basic proline-rich protein-like [Dipodomys spectabilis]|uniref:basic proline-rich protein-like n=1 Tax=Dipodomys spectabilis TaxID=105255 RepID=UPI001C547059|nr:basic proline-rich protein-like [Dipodomys spectabilis]